MTTNRQGLICAWCIGIALTGGCGTSKPVRYYALTAVNAQSDGAPPVARASVGITKVALPAYLDRPQIVTGGQGNRLILLDDDRWAEPLTEGCARVLAADLAALLPGHLVRHHGWLDKTQLDYVVTVGIERFERVSGGTVKLVADWSVERRGAQQPARTLRREYVQATDGPSTDALAHAMSAALSGLAGDIAVEINSGATP